MASKNLNNPAQAFDPMRPGNAQMLGAREVQEDYFATFSSKGAQVAVLADGMGGTAGGDVASEQALKAFCEALRESGVEDPPRDLQRALLAANQRLAGWQNANPDCAGMGTTLLALVLKPPHAYWISVGDSPLYRLRDGRLLRLNANHSFADNLLRQVAEGRLTEAEALADPDYHSITSALTGAPVPFVDCPESGIAARREDRFLLASDGIQTLSEGLIRKYLKRARDPQKAADRLISAVNRGADSGQDNCTVVTFFCDRPRPRRWIILLGFGLAGLLLTGYHSGLPEPVKRWRASLVEWLTGETVQREAPGPAPDTGPAAQPDDPGQRGADRTDDAKPEAPSVQQNRPGRDKATTPPASAVPETGPAAETQAPDSRK